LKARTKNILHNKKDAGSTRTRIGPLKKSKDYAVESAIHKILGAIGLSILSINLIIISLARYTLRVYVRSHNGGGGARLCAQRLGFWGGWPR
jgi:hypothetical protein